MLMLSVVFVGYLHLDLRRRLRLGWVAHGGSSVSGCLFGITVRFCVREVSLVFAFANVKDLFGELMGLHANGLPPNLW